MDTALQLVADGTLIVILALSVPIIIWWLRNHTWIKLPIIIMAGLTSLLVAKVLSLLYQPTYARPFIELGVQPGAAYIDNPGFPSDHALLATAAVIAVYVATRNKQLMIVLLALVTIMSIGRVLALVHTPIDVICGMLSAVAGSLWYKKLTR